MGNLKKLYIENVRTKLQEEFTYKNQHQIPKIEKIQVSCGLGLNAQNRVFLQKATEEIRLITGQQPILTSAKNSVAGFKIREGMPLGLTVTLRKEKMYSFLEKFIHLVLPRIRDFRGLNALNFDQRGNYNLGISEQLVFQKLIMIMLNKEEDLILLLLQQQTLQRKVFFIKRTWLTFCQKRRRWKN